MATRFTAQSVSEAGTTYTVAIDDSSFGGAATDIEINGFVLAYDPDEQEDPASSIISSTCTFQITVTSDVKSDINTLIADMIDADEGRFRIKITDASANIFWLGFVITDQVAYEDQGWADVLSAFQIRAVDGISRLKDLDYNNAGTAYSGRELIDAHIFNILNKIGLLDFYGAGDDVFHDLVRWYESGMSATVSDSPLEKTYIDHEAFITTDTEGNDEFLSCYDVLKEIARLFLARFYYSAGTYRLDQIKEYDESSVTAHLYLKAGTRHGTSNPDIWIVEDSDDVLRLGNVGAKTSFFAPARRIELAYKHVNDRNYLAGKQWDSTTAAETILQVGRENVRVWIRGTFVHSATFAPASGFPDNGAIFVFELTITCLVDGVTYYLKQDYTFNFASWVSYTTPEWTTTATDRYHIVADSINTVNALQATSNIDFETPDLPGSVEFATLSFDVALEDIYEVANGVLTVISPTSNTWLFRNVLFQLTSDDETALTETTVFAKDNADTPNASLVLEYDTLIGDSPSSTFFTSSSLTIDAPGAEQISLQWAKGVGGGGFKIQTLWLNELMTLRNKSLKRYEGQLIGTDYAFHKVWEDIPNNKWIGHRVSYDSKTDIWRGDWWMVGLNRALSGTIDDPVNEPGPGLVIGLPPGPGPIHPPSPGPGNVYADPIALAPPRQLGAVTDAPVVGGTPTTTIPITPIGSGCVISSGDTVYVYDPGSGNTYEFTVTSDVGGSDTSISVSSATPDATLGSGSYVVIDTGSFVSNIQGCIASSWYAEEFTVDNVDNVTVTVNGGTLPTSTAQMWVYYNGQLLPPTGNWSKAGAVVTFTFRAFGNVYVRFVI